MPAHFIPRPMFVRYNVRALYPHGNMTGIFFSLTRSHSAITSENIWRISEDEWIIHFHNASVCISDERTKLSECERELSDFYDWVENKLALEVSELIGHATITLAGKSVPLIVDRIHMANITQRIEWKFASMETIFVVVCNHVADERDIISE